MSGADAPAGGEQVGIVALRTVGPVLIELPIVIPANCQAWVASIWPAAGAPGWGRELWIYDSPRRGWTIPASCTHGTVLEVGAATIERRQCPARTHSAWYAVAIAHDHHWLICTSRFQNPGVAHQHARHLTDRYRHGIVERYRSHAEHAGSSREH